VKQARAANLDPTGLFGKGIIDDPIIEIEVHENSFADIVARHRVKLPFDKRFGKAVRQ